MTFPPASYGANSPQIGYNQAEGYWIAVGGDRAIAEVMAAIAMAESSLRPARVQEGQPYATTGWGLWQITPGNSVPQVGVDQQLLDGLTNARAALVKYRGQGLRAWSTYTSGAYRQYLQDAPPLSPPAAPPPTKETDMWGFIAADGIVHVYCQELGHMIEYVSDHPDAQHVWSRYDQSEHARITP